VIRNQQSKLGARPIGEEELEKLRCYGTGMTMDGYDTPQNIANALKNYINYSTN
jgi:predicted Zn-dependent peptidase